MNKEQRDLLLKAKKAILREPLQFTMGSWFTTEPEELWGSERDVPNCGTAACIAGWVITCSKPEQDPRQARETVVANRIYGENEEKLACTLLGVDRNTAQYLFYTSHWPNDMIVKWGDCETPEERAAVAAERIDQFIEQNYRKEKNEAETTT